MLFDNKGIGKSTNLTLYQIFIEHISARHDKIVSVLVIDCGFLLCKIMWERGQTNKVIFQQYVSFEQNYGQNFSAVFGDYDDAKLSTKSVEQNQCY